MLKERFGKLEGKLLSEIKSYYGERLISVVIFGSVARGAQRPDSDVDLLIIARGLPKGRMNRVREFHTIEDNMDSFLNILKTEGVYTYISPIFKTPEEAEKGSPLFLDMVEDARILFDRRKFFSEVLDKLKSRLKELGAKRVWRGDVWFWDLKPDYKMGEVFEI